MASRSPKEVVRAWNDAFARQDIDECMSYMSDDYVRHGDMSWESPMDQGIMGKPTEGFQRGFPRMDMGNIKFRRLRQHGDRRGSRERSMDPALGDLWR